MAIMTIVAGAIVVAMVGGMRHAQVKGTQAFFEAVKAQMAQYRDTHRMYMPGWSDGNSIPLWQALEYEGTFAAKKDFLEKVEEDDAEDPTFTDPTTGENVQRYRYIDAWRNPIEYECAPPFTRFELRSGGPDLEMYTDDDIVVTDIFFRDSGIIRPAQDLCFQILYL